MICIEGDVVKPIAECGGRDATHTKAECEDNDKDGLLAWEEAAIGTSDSIAQVGYGTNAQCDLATECDFQFKLGRSYCLPGVRGGQQLYRLPPRAGGRQR